MKVVSIADIALFIRNGKSIKQDDRLGGLPITRIETIADGTINSAKVGFAGISLAGNEDWVLKDGDILISHINSTKHLGKCAQYNGSPEPLIHGMNLLNLRCNQSKAFPRYVFHYLKSKQLLKQIPRITKNSVNQSSFTVTAFKELAIHLPPLPEQKRIAAILDKADAIRRKREKAIELTDSFLRSVFLEMFGDANTNLAKTNVKSIEQLISEGMLLLHKDGNFGSSYPKAEEFGDVGVPFLTARSFTDSGELIVNNVQFLNEDKADSLGYGWVSNDDVLLAHNATVGRVAHYNCNFDKALVGTSLTIYRPNKERLLPDYLTAALRSPAFQAQLTKNMSQTTRNQVPITAQRKLKIPVPNLDCQKEFSKIAYQVGLVLKRLNASQEHSKDLIRSLSATLLSEPEDIMAPSSIIQAPHAL